MNDDDLMSIVQAGIEGAQRAVEQQYPRSRYTALVVCVPVANELLAETGETTRARIRSELEEQITRILPGVEWPWEKPARTTT